MENASLTVPADLPRRLHGEVLLLVFDGDELHDPVLASARLTVSASTWTAHIDRELLWRYDEDYVAERISIAAQQAAYEAA